MKIHNHAYYSLLVCMLLATPVAQAATADDVECIRCVDTTDINYDAVTSNRILDGTIRSSDLGLDAVTSSRIKAGEVRSSDLAVDAVTTSKIKEGAVTQDMVKSMADNPVIFAMASCRCGSSSPSIRFRNDAACAPFKVATRLPRHEMWIRPSLLSRSVKGWSSRPPRRVFSVTGYAVLANVTHRRGPTGEWTGSPGRGFEERPIGLVSSSAPVRR